MVRNFRKRYNAVFGNLKTEMKALDNSRKVKCTIRKSILFTSQFFSETVEIPIRVSNRDRNFICKVIYRVVIVTPRRPNFKIVDRITKICLAFLPSYFIVFRLLRNDSGNFQMPHLFHSAECTQHTVQRRPFTRPFPFSRIL